MAIQVKKTLHLDLSKIPKSRRAEAKEEVAEFIEDTILEYISKGESPVEGEGKKFKGLSKPYKKVKGKISGSSKPNMELFGDYLDDFESIANAGNSVSFGFMDGASEESKLKADNHNKWTSKSTKTKVPKRRHIPKGPQNLRAEIMSDVDEILEGYAEDFKDTPEFDVAKAKRKEKAIKDRLDQAKQDLKELNHDEDLIKTTTAKRDKARQDRLDAEESIRKSKERLAELRKRLK